jgi:hypothetical protein
MKSRRLILSVLSALLLFGTSALSGQHRSKNHHHPDEGNSVNAQLTGFDEVPAIVTTGSGDFSATIDDTGQTITFTLTFSNLEGTTTASHIDVAQPDVIGGISAFLCGGGSKPACPASGTVTGTIVAADVIGPAAQGIAPGAFAKLVQAIDAGKTYVNVLSTQFPAGEIRGQIISGHGDNQGGDIKSQNRAARKH